MGMMALAEALIIQHLVAVNVSDAFIGNPNANYYSMLVLDDVNCYNCSGSIFAGSNITATNGSLLRVSKAVLMHSNGSIHSSLLNFYGNAQVVNGSLFDFRDCFSSQHFISYLTKHISVINNSAVSMTRISFKEGDDDMWVMFPTNVDKSSYVYAQQCSLGTSKLNTHPLLLKALMNVDGIVDENTGFLENTKVCAYAECIRANSNTEDSTDHCKCQCTRPGLYLPQCSAINDSVQSIIDDVTDNTNQEFCALSDASNNKICRVCNTGYVPTVT
ncbi:hypothetical protein O3M35_013327 [Rhynocoris fuscipes]|uniref:Uncharacterized protein n=1 Tax=Rhynocoris fuscipes TaxID=488301 RepID=A0AAW1CEG3_9HEMI